MIHPDLPPTLVGLRHAIAGGSLTNAEALNAQAGLLAGGAAHWRCVTQLFPLASPLATGPLSGVGLAHKDIFDTADRFGGCGRPEERQGRPSKPSAALELLRHAGAAHLGALSMAEFACGATGENPHFSRPVNPVDPAAAVGGSSSGSAVAVAAGLTYASLGTDTAGSVRIPAATCGIFGFKPTRGLIARDGVFPMAPSLDTVGVLSRSAADTALLLGILSSRPGELTSAATGSDQGIGRYLLQRRNWRVAVQLPQRHLAAEIGDVLSTFVSDLAPRSSVVPIELPAFDELTRCAEALMHVESAHVHWNTLRTGSGQLAAPTRAIVTPGAAIPVLWYREALARRASCLQAFVDACFGAADVLLVPALLHPIPDWEKVEMTSPQFDPRELLALFRWMPFVNYLGLPSATFPVGVDRKGRPVSIQAIARPFADASLLSFVYQVERERVGGAGFGAALSALSTSPVKGNAPSHH
jgi:Asp-tRNA(Asn)/Glu-tRNA(Gln) amidotransferase A subunit family amidase